jgi:hypothetical protein
VDSELQDEERASSADEDRALVALWEQVLERFDQESTHGAFLAACDEKKNLAFAATRYRKVKDEGDEAKTLEADRQLEKITALAFSQMETFRTAPKEHRRVITIIAAIVSFVLVGFCVYLIGM